MTDYVLIVRTQDGQEHISNPLDVHDDEQAIALRNELIDTEPSWFAFSAGVRQVAIPSDEVTYFAIVPVEPEVPRVDVMQRFRDAGLIANLEPWQEGVMSRALDEADRAAKTRAAADLDQLDDLLVYEDEA